MRDRRKVLIAILAAFLAAGVALLAAFLAFSERSLFNFLDGTIRPVTQLRGFSTTIRTIDYPGRGSHIRVAVLSASNFDAVQQIDQTSVTFGRTGDEPSLESCGADELNGDGVPDLVCQFDTSVTGLSRGVAQEGILRAMDVNRIRLEGRDTVTVPCDPMQPCPPP